MQQEIIIEISDGINAGQETDEHDDVQNDNTDRVDKKRFPEKPVSKGVI